MQIHISSNGVPIYLQIVNQVKYWSPLADSTAAALHRGRRGAAFPCRKLSCYCTPEELDADRKAPGSRQAAATLRRPLRQP